MKIAVIIICFLLLSACSPVLNRDETQPSSTNSTAGRSHSIAQDLVQVSDHSLQSLLIGEQQLEVEVVNTNSSISQGLSGRSQLGADGMLFVFPRSQIVTFWMKEMMFPLDLIWINNGLVVGVAEDIPAPNPDTPLSALPTYAPPTAVDMVLEVEAGKAKEWGIATGSHIKLLE
jgi:uncharacterized membrane protein (UPF0127 family)